MLFMTILKINRGLFPPNPDEVLGRHFAYLRRMREDGKLISAYMGVGGNTAFLLWEVNTPEELHKLVTDFPVSRYVEVDVVPVMRHPAFDDQIKLF